MPIMLTNIHNFVIITISNHERKKVMRKMRKIIILVICFVMIVVSIPMVANASDETVTIITNADELNAIRDNLDGDYILANDIDLSEFDNWTPIGSDTEPFTGSFDGNGYEIKNLSIFYRRDVSNGDDYISVGFFSAVTNGTIKNLGIVNASVRNLLYGSQTDDVTFCNAGGIAAILTNSVVFNCYYTGEIVAGTVYNSYSRAAAFGCASNSTISNCYASISLTAFASHMNTMAAGIVAWNDSSVIDKCYATGSISAQNGAGYTYCGGIAASGGGGITSNCVSLFDTISVEGNTNAGGSLIDAISAFDELKNNKSLDTTISSLSNRSAKSLTYAEAKEQSTYEDLQWDFLLNWKMSPEYPVLKKKHTYSMTNMTIRYDGDEYGTYPWDDDYFADDADQYNQSLATASLILELASWQETDKKDRSVIGQTFEEIGISDKSAWSQYPEKYTVGYDNIMCYIGQKALDDDTSLVVLAIRGGNYGAEWGGNFNLGSSGNHKGFDIAKTKVIGYLKEFISAQQEKGNLKGNLKIWVTGFSRAAATANLVAAELIDNTSYPEFKNLSNKNVYAYTFETPKNTVDKTHASSKYSSIFNIINPIDLIPYVAPNEMGFARYGVDLYYPTNMDKDYKTYRNAMADELSETFELVYDESFCFKGVSFDIPHGNTLELMSTIVDNKSMSQASYARNLISIISNEVFKSRANYYANLQTEMIPIIAKALGGEENDILESLLQTVKDKIINAGIHYGEFALPLGFAQNELEAWATQIINEYELSEANYNNIVSAIDDLILTLIKHPNYTLTTVANLEKKPVVGKTEEGEGVEIVFYSHTPEVSMAWMLSNPRLSRTLSYRKVQVNCPVDVNVYDSNGDLAASIVNDTCADIEDSRISYYIDDNGAKTFDLPNDEEYRIVMIATDNGSVTYSVYEYGDDGIELERVVNYYDIPIEEGDVLTGTVENRHSVSACAYPIVDNNNERANGAEILDSEVPTHALTISNNVDVAGLTTTGGEYIHGEFVRAIATSTDCYTFIGWYVNDELVSDKPIYRFAVTDDINLVAKYDAHHEWDNGAYTQSISCTNTGMKIYTCEKCEAENTEIIPATGHKWSSWTVVSEPTCTEIGIEQRVCSNDKSHVETREIAKTAHADIDGDGFCDNCDSEVKNGTTNRNACKYCGQVHEGFWGKFVGFFHKIVYFFAHLFGKM